MDIKSGPGNDVIAEHLAGVLMPESIYMELSSGYEAQIMSGSGAAKNKWICVLYSPGIIYVSYRG